MGVRLARRIVAALWRVICVFSWCLLGLWTALALFYNVPLPPWAATILTLAVAFLYASAFRERLFARGRQGTFWRETRRSLAALAVTAAVAVWYFDFIRPSPNEDWIPKHAEMPHVEIVGDDPGRLALALDRARQHTPVLLQPLVHLVVDRLRLPRVLARADDEEVGVGARRPHVEDDHVTSQLLLGDAGDAAGLFE